MRKSNLISIVVLSVMLAGSFPAIASEKAGRSTELNVSSTFDFSSHKRMTLEVNVQTSAEERVDVKVYMLPEHKRSQISENSVLFSGKTDESGFITRAIEVPQHVDSLYVEVANNGTVQEREMAVEPNAHVVLHF